MSNSTKKTKTFDCVEFKHQAQIQWFESTREMSRDEQREHSRQIIESGPLAEFWSKVQKHAKTAPKAGRLNPSP